MADDITASTFFSRFAERLEDQMWFQSLRAKWEELDPQSRTYTQTAILSVLAIAVVGTLLTLWLGVRSIHEEIETKSQTLHFIENANEELRELRSRVRGGGHSSETAGPPINWKEYIEGIAIASTIDRGSIAIQPEGTPEKTDLAIITPVEFTLKSITVRQLVRYLHALENGSHPLRVTLLEIKTVGNEGYLEAAVKVAVYALSPKNK